MMFDMRKIAVSIASLWMWPIFYLTRKSRHQDILLNLICKKIEDEIVFPSFRLRRKDSSETPFLYSLCRNNKIKLGIVLQGPISLKDDMSYKSIKFYKSIYPNSVIVLSTWSTEDKVLVKKCKDAGAVVVLSKPPMKPGVLNVNYQITSTLAGVKKAIELGADYIAKTRTDQRICKPYVLLSLVELLEKYPVISEKSFQEKRIVVMPTYINNMFTPYFMSDFFYFGQSQDILRLFSLKLDSREDISSENLVTRIDYSKTMYPPEIYILKNYFIKYSDITVTDTIKDYWECIKKYLICIDKNVLDLLITKYEYSYNDGVSESTFFSNDNLKRKMTMKWGFIEWLNLLNGNIQYIEEYENELYQVFK